MTVLSTPTPRQLDLTWRLGSTELLSCALVGPTPTLDISKITQVQFLAKDSSGETVVNLTQGNGGVTFPDPAQPIVDIEAPIALVATLSTSVSYRYGIRLTMSDGRKYEQQYGKLAVIDSVFAGEDGVTATGEGAISLDMSNPNNLWQAT